MRKKLSYIIILILFFIFLDLIIFFGVTRRYLSTSDLSKGQSINLEDYLPFQDGSKIVDFRTEYQLRDNLPVLDGATALYPVFSAIINAVYPKDSCEYKDNKFSETSKLQMNNTAGAYRAIVDGTSDLIFAAGPSMDQMEYAKEKGVELVFEPIGKEAFVFMVNSKNIVTSLTQDELRKIYSGEVTNWKEVGGSNRAIAPLQRAENSGSQTAFLKIMGDVQLEKRSGIIMIYGQSIGYSYRYYVEGIRNKGNIKLLAIDGVYPSLENIQNESYPFTNQFYVVYRKSEVNSNVYSLVDWIKNEGQDLVQQSGYVSLK